MDTNSGNDKKDKNINQSEDDAMKNLLRHFVPTRKSLEKKAKEKARKKSRNSQDGKEPSKAIDVDAEVEQDVEQDVEESTANTLNLLEVNIDSLVKLIDEYDDDKWYLSFLSDTNVVEEEDDGEKSPPAKKARTEDSAAGNNTNTSGKDKNTNLESDSTKLKFKSDDEKNKFLTELNNVKARVLMIRFSDVPGLDDYIPLKELYKKYVKLFNGNKEVMQSLVARCKQYVKLSRRFLNKDYPARFFPNCKPTALKYISKDLSHQMNVDYTNLSYAYAEQAALIEINVRFQEIKTILETIVNYPKQFADDAQALVDRLNSSFAFEQVKEKVMAQMRKLFFHLIFYLIAHYKQYVQALKVATVNDYYKLELVKNTKDEAEKMSQDMDTSDASTIFIRKTVIAELDKREKIAKAKAKASKSKKDKDKNNDTGKGTSGKSNQSNTSKPQNPKPKPKSKPKSKPKPNSSSKPNNNTNNRNNAPSWKQNTVRPPMKVPPQHRRKSKN